MGSIICAVEGQGGGTADFSQFCHSYKVSCNNDT